MTAPAAPPSRSMLRSYTVADLFTIANASCGTVAIFLCLDYMAFGDTRRLWIAIALLPLALGFDVLDGTVARMQPHRQSVLGADLDSLADVISFGVAPAVLGYTLGLRGGWDMIALVYFVVCGVSRLARFNATAAALTDAGTGKVRYFEGTPIPTSIGLVLLLALALWLGHVQDALWLGRVQAGPMALHPLVLAFVASGTGMISRVRIPKP
jgi:CDP-diacylglycerol--serine O-phosphatidyltransferase